jgi:hypothetical protein
MKAKFWFLLAFLLPSVAVMAQKIDDHEVEFDYVRLPKNPAAKATKTYSSEVVLAYEVPILAEQAKAQQEYDAALNDFPGFVKAEEARHKERVDKYNADMAAWKEKSVASKIVEKELLHENNKPVDPGPFYPPTKPYLRVVPHEKIFSKDMLNSTYLKLDGCTARARQRLEDHGHALRL